MSSVFFSEALVLANLKTGKGMGWSGAFPDRNFLPEELTLARLLFLEREGQREAPP